MTRHRLLVSLVAVAVLTGVGAPGDARDAARAPTPTPSWGTTVALSDAGRARAVLVVASPGPSRTIAAGWWRSAPPGGEVGALSVATRRPGHPWSKPVRVGLGEIRWTIHEPWLAVDGAGGVTVVWSFGAKVFSRYKPPGRAWRPRAVVHAGPSFTTGATPLRPAVWVNRAGAAMVTWEWCDQPDLWAFDCYKWAAYRTAAGRWLPATRLEHEHTYAGGGQVTIDRRGNVMRYAEVPKIHADTVRSYRPGQGWGKPVALGARRAFLAVGNAAGDQVFLTKEGAALRVRTKAPRGAWGDAVEVARGAPGGAPWPSRAALTLDRRGRAMVAYVDRSWSWGISVVESRADGTWSTPDHLSIEDHAAYLLATGVDTRGDRVVAWYEPHDASPDPPEVWAVYREPGSGWSEPSVISPSRTLSVSALVAAVRSDGAPVVGWRGRQGQDASAWRRFRVRVAVPPG